MMINLDFIYPIGTIYETTSTVHPNISLGGTWELYGSGRVTVCYDSSQTEFATIEQTGGEKTHTLTVNEMPSHNHKTRNDNTGGGANQFTTKASVVVSNSYDTRVLTESTGGSKPHNNLQPYIVVYRYRRVA